MGKRIVVAMAVAVALSSCQKKAEGQTVAIVNGEEITASDLNSELNSENLPLTGSTQAARAAALQKLVDRRLLAQEAKNEGLDKSPEYINQLRRSTDDLLINLVVSRKMNTVGVPTAAEISRFEASHPETFSNRETWTLEQIIYPLPKDKTVIAKLAAAKTFDEVAQALTGSGIQFTRGTRKIDTAIFPHAIYAQIVALPPGEPFIAPGPDKAIASVISAREPNPLPPEQARQVALAGIKREQLDKFVQDRVKDLKATAKIQYQPGFAVKS